MSLRTAFRSFLFFVLLAGLATGAWAQATALLRGTIMDPAGAVVPNAKLTLTNVATRLARDIRTDATGGYLFAAIPPGIYQLKVEAQGFKTLVREDLKLSVSLPTTLDLSVELGQLTEVISVEAEARLLNTSDATIGNVIGNRQISQLPLEARNIIGLLSLQAGVTFVNNTEAGLASVTGGVNDNRNASVNGGKADQSNITLDGVDINDQLYQSINGALRVTLDSVEEFRMTTATPTATQGRSSGAQINMVTRSGTNIFHGSAYEYHRNTVTSANEWFLNQSKVPRRKYIKNVFGASGGGPIVKDRFFFFLNFEGRRDRQESAALRIVPSNEMRNSILKYRASDGTIKTLSPEQVKELDPAKIGASPAVLAIFKQYPLPNDPTQGDGINLQGFRFAAPLGLDQNTYIAKFDYKTSDSKHNLFWRGNLQDDKGSDAPQFPQQAPRFTRLDNSRASAVGYTYVIKPTLVNDFRWGFTRQGLELAGVATTNTVSFRNISDLTFGGGPGFAIPRSSGRKLPTHNIVDDVNWNRGSHTLQFGGNLRWIRRDSFDYGSSFHTASTNASWLRGTGVDLRPADIDRAFGVAMSDAMMATLGIVSFAQSRYNYDRTGTAQAAGAPVKRLYGTNEYEWYIQDAWKVRPNFSLILGVRHSLFSPPWELRGNQVVPNVNLGQWFDQRGGGMAKGVPSNQAPRISFLLGGKANNGPGVYGWDKNNFAPRVAIAYSPGFSDGWFKKLTGGPGRTSIRAGYSVVYDRVGAGLLNTFDVGGSFGMSTSLQNVSGFLRPFDPDPTRMAPRFTGLASIPSLIIRAAPPGGFPATPRLGDLAITSAIDQNLRTPYSQMLSFSIQRQLPYEWSLELGYVGRLSRKSLINDDLAMPLDLVDTASGTTYFQAANLLVNQYRNNVPTAQVGKIPFWENLFPGLASGGLSATQVAYNVYRGYRNDETSGLFDFDGFCDPSCSKFGNYAFFADQFSALAAWRSRGIGNYHALQVMLRKRFSRGHSLDLNYTWSKSVDWASAIERDGSYSGFTVNAWSPGLRRGVSDYDLTHQINVNGIYELPFGKGRRFGGGANRGVDAIIGGWQINGIYRHTTGLPTFAGNGRFWPTNWNISGGATVIPEKGHPKTETTKNAPAVSGTGGPNIFPDPRVAREHFVNTRPGQVGDRNNIRGDGIFNIDLSLGKYWRMPYAEGHRLQFRWEIFNVTNSVRFDVRQMTLDLGNIGKFGQYSGTLTQPRVMQFGLRYEF